MKAVIDGLRSWLARLRQPGSSIGRQTLTHEVLLWAGLSVGVALVSGWLATSPPGDLPWWVVTGCLLLLAVALVAIRDYPSIALLGTAMLSLVTAWFSVALCVMSYLYGRRAGKARSAVLAFGMTVTAGTLLILVARGTLRDWLVMVSVVVFGGLLPWLVGRYRRQRSELVQAGWLRAEMLEREQEVMAEQVRLRERARIAQEMHDSLGHEISLIALRAGAFEVASDLDERHRAAAEQLRKSAAAATDRLREIIGVLREDDGTVPTQPASETITDLVERARASGMQITFHHDGDRERSPEMVDRAAYCVVRESLTNAAKHAPAAPVTVRLVYAEAHVDVTIVNERPAGGPIPGRPRGGQGLIGMRERVRVVGGVLHVEPRPTAFEVAARLPYAGNVADPAVPADGGLPLERDTESYVDLSRGRRQLRRDLVAVIIVPIVVLVALSFGYYSYTSFNAVLDSSSFERLQVGQDRADIAALLPSREVPGRPDAEPPIPPGSSCEYYTDGSFLVRTHVYRLCFRDDQLVAKDARSS